MGFLEVAALKLSLEGWVEVYQETCSVISGGWCGLESSSQAPLPSALLDSAPPPPHEKERRLIRYGGPVGWYLIQLGLWTSRLGPVMQS